MMMPRLRTVLVPALAALFAPALPALDIQNPPPAHMAGPGTLNYIEGSALIDGQPVAQSNHGYPTGYPTLEAGQEISTTNGRAEMLLTPGIFLRLGHNSAVKMVTPDLTDTVVEVEHGRATVEVDQLFQDNDIHVLEDRVPVQLVKTGLYEFDADHNTMMVFSGKAAALRPNEKFVTVKDDHELNLAEVASAKPQKFDEKTQEQSGLYRWSSLRSDYLAEDNQQLAPEYGAGYAPGWYWDPYAWNYTFLGAYPFYSPFGWGFYPFGYWGGIGWGGGWGYPGYYGGGYYGRGHLYNGGHLNSGNFHRIFGGSGPVGGGNAFRGSGEMGGFHGGSGMGGFHGGGGMGGGHGR